MLSEDIIINILCFFNINICCKNKELNEIIKVNKEFNKIINSNFKLKYFKWKKFNNQKFNINLICCNCDNINDSQFNIIKDIDKNRYNNKYNPEEYDVLKKNSKNAKFIHLNNNLELTQFINIIRKKRIKIYFGDECCGGKGCKIYTS